MNNTVAAKAKREPYLDVLKGVAMIGVILAHYYLSPNPVLIKIATVGSRCPQLFFIASAFLTWKVLDKNNREKSYKEFYKKRIFRIGPVYWVALLIALLLPVTTFKQHTIGDILTHIFFLNGLVPSWANNIMHVEWYITDLAILYLCCPFLRRVAYNLKSSLVTLFIAILLSSVSLIVTNNIFTTQISENASWEMYFHTFFFLNQLPVWMLGVVTYYWMKVHDNMSWRGVLLLLVMVLIMTVAFEQFNLNKRYISSSLIAGLDFTWLFLLCNKIGKIFHYGVFKPLEWIGKHSYGIYCFHFVAIRTLFYYDFIRTDTISGWTLGLILSIAVSILVGYVVEACWSKMQKRIKK